MTSDAIDDVHGAKNVRLLCFHHAGASSSAFRAWRRSAAPNIDVIPVELPTTRPVTGRRIHADATDLVEHLIDEYADVLIEPVVLYGHSMGGLLAYLTARQLTSSRELASPSALIVAASWSPRMRPSLDVDVLTDAALVGLLGELGGVPADLLERPEWLAPMLPLIRDDLRMCGHYAHDPVGDVLDIPVHVIAADDDRLVNRAQTAGWGPLGSSVSIEYQRGGHFFDADPNALQRRVFELAVAAARGGARVRAAS